MSDNNRVISKAEVDDLLEGYDPLGAADDAEAAATAAAIAGLAAHVSASDPHGDRAFSTAAIATHAGATDPHGDRAYAASLFAANDALVFKGVIDCSANPNYPSANAGETYKVSVAGRIGGGSGPRVEVGELLLCTVDSSASGNHATVGANWTIGQVNIDGAVTGPTSATDGHVVVMDGTSGRLVKDGGALTKALVGLGSVDNVADLDKPVSSAQQTAIDSLSSSIGTLAASLGTAAPLNVPSSGDATSGQVVKGSDSRLTNTRTPTDATVTTAKLAANAVTNAKAAQMAAKTFKARHTNSTGDPEDVSAANVLADLSGQAGADFDMNAKKLANIANGSSSGDAIAYGQVSTVGRTGSASDLASGTVPDLRLPSRWKKLGDVTVSNAGAGVSQVQVTGLSGYRFLRVKVFGKSTRTGTSSTALGIRFNTDSGANYSNSTSTGQTALAPASSLAPAGVADWSLIEFTVANLATAAKQIVGAYRYTIGVGAAQLGGSWNDTTNVISTMELFTTNNIADGTWVLVEGWA